MGIIILVLLALGIFSVLRAVYSCCKARMKTSGGAISAAAAYCKPLLSSTKASTNATPATAQPAVLNEPDWLAYEVPAFIRRGISRPVLTEKQKKRVRKAKSANAPLAAQLVF